MVYAAKYAATLIEAPNRVQKKAYAIKLFSSIYSACYATDVATTPA